MRDLKIKEMDRAPGIVDFEGKKGGRRRVRREGKGTVGYFQFK